MLDCVFCQIIKGEVPCYKIYEDKDFLGFLDIYPIAKGHCLLIPKVHYRWVYEVPNFGEYWKIAKKVSLIVKKIVKADSINYLTIGEEIEHAHIWIIPRFKGDSDVIGIKRMKNKPNELEMQGLAKQINFQSSQE